MRKLLSILLIFGITGCASISSMLTPNEVIDGVARGYMVAKIAEEDTPVGDDLKNYLSANRELWQQLAEYFGLIKMEKSEEIVNGE